VVHPEARLVDGERAARQRLGPGVGRLRIRQNAEIAEQPGRRLGNLRHVRMARDRERVRRERIEDRPASHVVGIADERRVHPFQRLAHSLLAALRGHRAIREILHEAMHDKSIPSARTIARLMTFGRNNLSKADAVTITAIEKDVPCFQIAKPTSVLLRTMAWNSAIQERAGAW
jgi:hypothetical protein